MEMLNDSLCERFSLNVCFFIKASILVIVTLCEWRVSVSLCEKCQLGKGFVVESKN